MKLNRQHLVAALVLVLAATTLHAQGGCTDSPEASTDVLMLVGSIGMVYGSAALRKLLGR